MVIYLIVSILAYFIGSVSFAVIFGRKFAGVDVREKGSKNAGTTNTLRVAGKKAAIFTLICDILKGVLPILVAVFLARWTNMSHGYLLPQVAGISVILGHMFSIYYKFKGGKGIATGIGVILVLNWQIALIVALFALLVMLLSRYVSLGSISGVTLYFVLSIFLRDANIIAGPTITFVVTALIIAVLIIYKHRENIKRLKKGEENKISFKKKDEN